MFGTGVFEGFCLVLGGGYGFFGQYCCTAGSVASSLFVVVWLAAFIFDVLKRLNCGLNVFISPHSTRLKIDIR